MRATLTVFAIAWAMIAVCQGSMTLGDRLSAFQQLKEIKISFDAELLGLITEPKSLDNLSPTDLIDYLQNNYPLKVEQVDSSYYYVVLSESEYHISLQDSLGSTEIIPELSSVLVNGSPIPLTVKDNQLRFSLKPSLRDTIQIYTPGFANEQLKFSTLLNRRSFEVILNPQFIELEDLVIRDYLTEGINLDPANQSIDIDVSALPLLPGETDGDLFASLSALPGITTPDNRAGNLYIRGSSTDQSYVMLDNIPIYSKGHYFGTISPYNPKVIDEVEVHRNGFHPRRGGRVGGAVEIKTEPKENGTVSGGVGANTLFAMAYVKAPLAKNKVGINFGARRSFPTSFISPKLEAITEMVYAGSAITDNATGEVLEDVNVIFEDYQLGLTYQPNPKNRIHLSNIYTFSKIDYSINSPQGGRFPEQFDGFNLGSSGQWTSKINNRVQSDFTISLSAYRSQFRAGDALDNEPIPTVNGAYSINSIQDLSISEEIQIMTTKENKLDLGIEYRYQDVYDNYKGPTPNNNPDYTRLNEESASTISPYASYAINQWKNWFVQLGGRLNYFSKTNEVDFAPRVFANWFASKNFTLKGSAGFYNQYISQVKVLEFSSGGFDNELWQLADNNTTYSIHGSQSMLGGVWDLNKWVIDVEAYYKTANNVTYYSATKLLQNATFFRADHEAYGVDLFIRRKFGDYIESWLGYSYSQLLVHTDTLTYDGRYSQPHSLNTGISFHKNNFKTSIGWRLSSGLDGNSIESANFLASYENNTNGNGNPDAISAFDSRFPMVHFLDASISYKIPKTDDRKWSSTFGLSVINVYNQENLTDRVVRTGSNPRDPNIIDRNAIGFAPNLMITFEW
ncbi:TonB-dependent receptor plug domain-containing protein [Marinoscillum sp.]|uniref:TonB-dependent receptor plug domain-containing protein n=1 Tax=Marinoscillum sp. TaxID=2024838 RepID=UPI003BA8D7AD